MARSSCASCEIIQGTQVAPLPVRERMIPKASGKLRRLGIPTARDRVVQASLKLVLEPIFEAEFHPCSYGFRPKRRAQDAIEEIRHFSGLSYEWILEGDISSCFDQSRTRPSWAACADRSRTSASLRFGEGVPDQLESSRGRGGQGLQERHPAGRRILSPLLANIALSVLDEHFAEVWETTMAGNDDRKRRRRRGEAMYRLVRYADNFVVLVSGTKAQAEALKVDTAAVLSTIAACACRTRRRRYATSTRGSTSWASASSGKSSEESNKALVYSWPCKKALASIMAKIKAITTQGTNNPLSDLLRQINAALRGWTVYFSRERLRADLYELPGPLHVAPRGWMVAPKAPPCYLEVDPAALPRHPGRAGAPRRRSDALQPRIGAGHPVPL